MFKIYNTTYCKRVVYMYLYSTNVLRWLSDYTPVEKQ